MRRRSSARAGLLGLLLLLTLAALGVLLSALRPLPVVALASARRAAATSMVETLRRTGIHGPTPDRILVLDAWRAAGVAVARITTASGASQAGAPPPSDDADLRRACARVLNPTVSETPERGGPAPGDYVLYGDPGGQARVGMFVSATEVVIWDPAAGRTRVVERPALDGSAPRSPSDRLPVAADGPDPLLCRLAPALWPGGVDDLSQPAGRVSLVDPDVAWDRVRWAQEHPRDADVHWWTPVTRVSGVVAGALAQAFDEALGAVEHGAAAVLRRFGPEGVTALALAGLLTRRIDARGAHRVLTWVVAGALLIWQPELIGVVIAGAVAGHLLARTGLPVLGGLGGAAESLVVHGLSFLATIVFGTQANRDTTVGSIAFALVSDGLIFAKPLKLLRLVPVPWMARVSEPLHTGLEWAGTASDLVGGRPTTVVGFLRHAPTWLGGVSDRTVEAGRRVAQAWSAAPSGTGRLQAALDALTGHAPHPLGAAPADVSAAAARAAHAGHSTAVGAAAPAAAPHAIAPLTATTTLLPMTAREAGIRAATHAARRVPDLVSLSWRPGSLASDLVGHADAALQHFAETLDAVRPEAVHGADPAALSRLAAVWSRMDPERRAHALAVARRWSGAWAPRAVSRLSHFHSGAWLATAGPQLPSIPEPIGAPRAPLAPPPPEDALWRDL